MTESRDEIYAEMMRLQEQSIALKFIILGPVVRRQDIGNLRILTLITFATTYVNRIGVTSKIILILI